MKTNFIGSSDMEVGRLGVGCWSFGGGAYWGEQSQKDVEDVVNLALDNGMNFFDTAEMYNDGASEESLGAALKGKRNKAVIGTKFIVPNACDVRADDIVARCNASLKRLQTDYIDLYMLHWPLKESVEDHEMDDQGKVPSSVLEVFEGMDRLKQAGKVRWIGVSNHGVKQMSQIKKTGVQIVANELPYNLISRAIEGEIAPYCIEAGIGIIGYMSLQQGILAGIYNTLDEVPEAQLHSRHFSQQRGGDMSRHQEDGAEEEINVLLKNLKEIARDLNVSIPRLSLAYALKNNAIACTLVGSRNRNQLMSNLETEGWELPDDVYAEMTRLSNPVLEKLGYSPDYYENRNASRIY